MWQCLPHIQNLVVPAAKQVMFEGFLLKFQDIYLQDYWIWAGRESLYFPWKRKCGNAQQCDHEVCLVLSSPGCSGTLHCLPLRTHLCSSTEKAVVLLGGVCCLSCLYQDLWDLEEKLPECAEWMSFDVKMRYSLDNTVRLFLEPYVWESLHKDLPNLKLRLWLVIHRKVLGSGQRWRQKS